MDTLWALDKNKGLGQLPNPLTLFGVPKGIRTPVADVKGRCPWPTRRWGRGVWWAVLDSNQRLSA